MCRLNTTHEVLAYSIAGAVSDLHKHLTLGHDLNPFCTQSARHDWQKGFDGKPLCDWEGKAEWNTIYQRGRIAFLLLQEA